MKIDVSDYEAKDIIRIIREWAEMTQKEFGESIYMSRMAIQYYERGKRRCSIDTLLKMIRQHQLKITIEGKEKKG